MHDYFQLFSGKSSWEYIEAKLKMEKCDCSVTVPLPASQRSWVWILFKPEFFRLSFHKYSSCIIQTCAISEQADKTGHYLLWDKVKFIDSNQHW